MRHEFDLIRSIAAAASGITGPATVREGIGDDCAVLPQAGGLDTLVSTDLLCEGTHFLLDRTDPRRLGWKAAAVNFSDIAAMGGEVTASFLAMGLPEGTEGHWVEEFIGGYTDISRRCSVPLAGGDTCRASDGALTICVTVTGQCPSGTALTRSGARPGDLIYVTGCLGDSAAGLDIVLKGEGPSCEEEQALTDRHFLPTPRIREGIILRNCKGVHAMMDISDGIGSDLRHILEASGVGAEVDTDSIPISPELSSYCRRTGLDPLVMACDGGEDYELLLTASSGAALPGFCRRIGRVTQGRGIEWKGSGRDFRGYRHF